MSRAVFDRDGHAVSWLDDDGSLYDVTGMPLGYLALGRLYAYGGEFLAWFDDGWFLDSAGRAGGFLHGVKDGPMLPPRHVPPARAPSFHLRPAREPRGGAPARAPRASSWVSWDAITTPH